MPIDITIINTAGGSTSLSLNPWPRGSKPTANAIRFDVAISAAMTAATVTAVGRSPGRSGSSRSRARSSLDGRGASSASAVATGGGTGGRSRRRRLRLCLPDTRAAQPRAPAASRSSIRLRSSRAAVPGSSASRMARTTATRCAPASTTVATFDGSMPPIAKNGTVAFAAA